MNAALNALLDSYYTLQGDADLAEKLAAKCRTDALQHDRDAAKARAALKEVEDAILALGGELPD